MGALESLDDQKLVARICTGRLEFFEILVDRHLSHIRVYIAFHAASFDLVAGITQETFVFALTNLHLFKTGTEFRGWLRAIALELIRAENKRAWANSPDRFSAKRCEELERQQGPPYASKEVELLEGVLRQLPESLGMLLKLKYREKISTEQLALTMGRTVVSTRLVLFRIRQGLWGSMRDKIKEDTDDAQ